MKTTWISLLAALALTAGTSERASAQPGGNAMARGSSAGGGYVSGGGRGGIVMLLAFSEVQQDLGLSDKQKEALRAMNHKVQEHERTMVEELKNPPTQPSAQWHVQRQNAAAKVIEQARQEIAQALTPAQMRRLEQISLQELGAEALFRPDIARALNLSPSQRQKLTQINGQANQQLAAWRGLRGPRFAGPQARGVVPAQGPPAAGGNNASGGARAGAGYSTPKGPGSPGEIIKDSERRMIEEVLTPQQQAKLKELQGAPCPLRPHYIPRMGGGGGGGGSYGGGGGAIRQ